MLWKYFTAASLGLFFCPSDAWGAEPRRPPWLGRRRLVGGAQTAPSSSEAIRAQVHLSSAMVPWQNDTTQSVVLQEYCVDSQALYGFGTEATQFARFVGHHLGLQEPVPLDQLTNRTVDAKDSAVQAELKGLWTEGRLLVSALEPYYDSVVKENEFKPKLLRSVQRMRLFMHSREGQSPEELRQWLQSELSALNLLKGRESDYFSFHESRTFEEHCGVLKELMQWFQPAYPYYHATCLTPECSGPQNTSFLGIFAATEAEKVHHASRAELLLCSACGEMSRFPRFNDALKVLFESKLGRCGEFSMCALALLESLGYTSRWVVDWSDHVWVEALLDGKW